MRNPAMVATPLGGRWRAAAGDDWLAAWTPAPFAFADGTGDVVAAGGGRPVVLVPPLPGYKEAWLACIPPLARRFRVVTYDLRQRFAPGPRWPQLLADLDAVADRLAPGRLVLVGHSLGGALAMRWAARRPERVAALVLSSTFARVSTPVADVPRRWLEQPLVLAAQRWLPRSAARALARRLADGSRWVYDPACDARVLAFVGEAIRATPIPLALARVGLAFDHDARAEIAAIAAPTLIVRGERESAFVRESCAALARRIPGAVVAQSPGTGHLHPLSAPEWLCERIAAWADAHA